MHRRTKAAAAVVALASAVAAVLVMTMGNAAALAVSPGRLGTFSATHPCPGVVLPVTTPTTSGTSSSVTVTVPEALPAACASRTLRVGVVAGGGTLREGTVTGVTPGTSLVVALDGAYAPAPTGVAVGATFDGWGVGATWSYDPPPVTGPDIVCTTNDPTRPCTATVELRDGHVWATGYDLDIEVRDARQTNANNPVEWTVTIDFRNARYPWVPNGLDGWSVVPASTCADLPVLTLTGRPDHWNHELRRGTVVTFSVQPHNDGTGNILSCS